MANIHPSSYKEGLLICTSKNDKILPFLAQIYKLYRQYPKNEFLTHIIGKQNTRKMVDLVFFKHFLKDQTKIYLKNGLAEGKKRSSRLFLSQNWSIFEEKL